MEKQKAVIGDHEVYEIERQSKKVYNLKLLTMPYNHDKQIESSLLEVSAIKVV